MSADENYYEKAYFGSDDEDQSDQEPERAPVQLQWRVTLLTPEQMREQRRAREAFWRAEYQRAPVGAWDCLVVAIAAAIALAAILIAVLVG
mgnify:CR=1 FL=1